MGASPLTPTGVLPLNPTGKLSSPDPLPPHPWKKNHTGIHGGGPKHILKLLVKKLFTPLQPAIGVERHHVLGRPSDRPLSVITYFT